LTLKFLALAFYQVVFLKKNGKLFLRYITSSPSEHQPENAFQICKAQTLNVNEKKKKYTTSEDHDGVAFPMHITTTNTTTTQRGNGGDGKGINMGWLPTFADPHGMISINAQLWEANQKELMHTLTEDLRQKNRCATFSSLYSFWKVF
jgi:hypothetical protein